MLETFESHVLSELYRLTIENSNLNQQLQNEAQLRQQLQSELESAKGELEILHAELDRGLAVDPDGPLN